MLEQYRLPVVVGEDVLERGLVLERIKVKAAMLEGTEFETDEELLRKAAGDADKG